MLERALRPEAVGRLAEVPLDPYVTDTEMLELMRVAYFDLVERVLLLHEELLGESGERYDPELDAAALTSTGLAVKVHGFRGALGRLFGLGQGHRWVRKAFQWADVILGSLGAVPALGVIPDAIKELKESVETQADDDHGP